LARPTSVIRVDDELAKIIKEISERNNLKPLDASAALAQKIRNSKKVKDIDWNLF